MSLGLRVAVRPVTVKAVLGAPRNMPLVRKTALSSRTETPRPSRAEVCDRSGKLPLLSQELNPPTSFKLTTLERKIEQIRRSDLDDELKEELVLTKLQELKLAALDDRIQFHRVGPHFVIDGIRFTPLIGFRYLQATLSSRNVALHELQHYAPGTSFPDLENPDAKRARQRVQKAVSRAINSVLNTAGTELIGVHLERYIRCGYTLNYSGNWRWNTQVVAFRG